MSLLNVPSHSAPANELWHASCQVLDWSADHTSAFDTFQQIHYLSLCVHVRLVVGGGLFQMIFVDFLVGFYFLFFHFTFFCGFLFLF